MVGLSRPYLVFGFDAVTALHFAALISCVCRIFCGTMSWSRNATQVRSPLSSELNSGLSFSALTKEQQGSFYPSPVPVLVRFERGDCVYKWTSYTALVNPKNGSITEYWSPWESFMIGDRKVDGFKEFRMRHSNLGGAVGRPQQAARALAAVTEQWNGMRSIIKAQFKKPVWGFAGKARYQRKFNDSAHPDEQDNVFFIGGAYQVVIPNLTPEWIEKL